MRITDNENLSGQIAGRNTISVVTKRVTDRNHNGVEFVFTINFFGNDSPRIADTLNKSARSVIFFADNLYPSGYDCAIAKNLHRFAFDIKSARATTNTLEIVAFETTTKFAKKDAEIISNARWKCVLSNGFIHPTIEVYEIHENEQK